MPPIPSVSQHSISVTKNENTPKILIQLKAKYKSTHLSWLQFLEQKFETPIQFLYIYHSKIICLLDSAIYQKAVKNWQLKLMKRRHCPSFRVRLIEYSEDLRQLIQNWFANIKNLNLSIQENLGEIIIQIHPSTRLRQFIIGKDGSEIKLLQQFLNENNQFGINFQIEVF